MNLLEWRRSIVALGFHITRLSRNANLLSDTASERGEFFFSDHGVPLPRPSTALAWASLCAFGPSTGVWDVAEQRLIEFNVTKGRFLLPFLPKIMHNEETEQSLGRASKAHVKDPKGRIRWGNVFIGDSETGEIIEQLPHGQRVAKEWMDHSDKRVVIPSWVSSAVPPPLFAYTGEGYQLGVIQHLPSIPVLLRDPMVELAKRGILELKYGGPNAPRVRRLLIRFLDVHAAKRWAQAYSEAMKSAYDQEAIRNDIHQLLADIEEAEKKPAKKTAVKSKGRIAEEFAGAFEDMLSIFDESMKGGEENRP